MGLHASNGGSSSAVAPGPGTRAFRAAMASLAVVLVSFPLLERSLGIDESMLLASFPLGGLFDVLNPLPRYDQASPALFSLFLNMLAGLDLPVARSVELFALSFCAILLLAGQDGRWRTFGLGGLSLLLFPTSFIMLSEFKHYAFEALGGVAAMTWFAGKDPEEAFAPRDVLLIVGITLLGISTLVICGIAVGLYALARCTRRRMGAGELLALAGLAVGAALYYLHVQYISAIQLGNNPSAYADSGAWKNAVALLRAWRSALGAPGLVLLALAAVMH